jgi:Mn2+/Fe2+ NRAMP family transporter
VLTSRRGVMGADTNAVGIRVLAGFATTVIVALNVALIFGTLA